MNRQIKERKNKSVVCWDDEERVGQILSKKWGCEHVIMLKGSLHSTVRFLSQPEGFHLRGGRLLPS